MGDARPPRNRDQPGRDRSAPRRVESTVFPKVSATTVMLLFAVKWFAKR
jgi:hypothetical protein